jgi:hypothetical protein
MELDRADVARRQLYAFAHLGGIECGLFRLRGVGLANCLFPWARCAVACRRYGISRVGSTWAQLCHRQWMRWDYDKRTYARLFDERSECITGLRKLQVIATKPWIREHDFLRNPVAFQGGVVVFSGIDGYFGAMLDEFAFLRQLLIASTRAKHKVGLRGDCAPEISIHVRRGDFIDPDSPASSRLGLLHLRQPITWFVHMLNTSRQQLGNCVPARVFSDATDDELRPLLALPRVKRSLAASSIGDLLALTTAPLLIASGSTFSMWAAYLGRMPVIWPKGQRRQRLHGAAWEYEIELGYEAIPEDALSLVRERLLADPVVWTTTLTETIS